MTFQNGRGLCIIHITYDWEVRSRDRFGNRELGIYGCPLMCICDRTRENLPVQLASSVGASVIAVLATSPFDMVKTWLQMYKTPVAVCLLKKEEWVTFQTGRGLCLIHITYDVKSSPVGRVR